MKKSRRFIVALVALVLIMMCLPLSACQMKRSITIGAMTNGKIVADKTKAVAGEIVKLTVTPNDNYGLVVGSLKVYYHPDLIQADNTFVMPDEDITITATFEKAFNIEYGPFTHGNVTGVSYATAGTTINLTISADDGYGLSVGSLKYNDTKIEGSSFIMPRAEVVVKADFIEKHTVTYAEMTNGKVTVDKTMATSGETINVLVEPNQGYILSGNSLKFNNSNISGTSFVMPNANVVITAVFEEYKYKRVSEKGEESVLGNYILFGEYPQTIATAQAVATMSKVADADGYFTSGNSRYAKVVATVTGGYAFSDKTTKVQGAEYYFRVEPIKWKILSVDLKSGTALINSQAILEEKAYLDKDNCQVNASNQEYYNKKNGSIVGTFANNWQYSNMREWLNQQFYNGSFSKLQQALIQNTSIDNKTTSYFEGESNGYATCQNNTEDKIFLLSYKDLTNTNYGFSSNATTFDKARQRGHSDYVRAKGTNASAILDNNCWWWMRSASFSGSKLVSGVSTDGVLSLMGNDVTMANRGVSPSLVIKL